jgi:hypothetical protein
LGNDYSIDESGIVSNDATDADSGAKARDPLADAAARSRKRASDRLDIVHEEVDRLRDDIAERRRSVNARASFLAVASGVLIAASATNASDDSNVWLLVHVALSVLGLIAAAVSTIPENRRELSAVRLGDKYIDSEKSPAMIFREILDSKILAIAGQERTLRRRGYTVTLGFSALIVSAIIFVLIRFMN